MHLWAIWGHKFLPCDPCKVFGLDKIGAGYLSGGRDHLSLAFRWLRIVSPASARLENINYSWPKDTVPGDPRSHILNRHHWLRNSQHAGGNQSPYSTRICWGGGVSPATPSSGQCNIAWTLKIYATPGGGYSPGKCRPPLGRGRETPTLISTHFKPKSIPSLVEEY